MEIMYLTLQITPRQNAKLAIGAQVGSCCLWVGFRGPWEEVEPGATRWRAWIFENREHGKGGILYRLIRWPAK